jgi:hypothetical protein
MLWRKRYMDWILAEVITLAGARGQAQAESCAHRALPEGTGSRLRHAAASLQSEQTRHVNLIGACNRRNLSGSHAIPAEGERR